MNLLRIIKNWFAGAFEIILFFPAVLLLYLLLKPNPDIWLWAGVLSLNYLGGSLASSLLGKRNVIVYGMIGIITSCVVAVPLMGFHFNGYAGWIIGGYLFYRGVLLQIHSWNEVLPLNAFLIALLFYFISPLVYLFFLFDGYLNLLWFTGAASLIMTIAVMNKHLIQSVSLSRNKEITYPASLLQQNRVYIISLVLVVFFISYFGALERAFVKAIRAAVAFVVRMVLAILGIFGSHAAEKIQKKVEQPAQEPAHQAVKPPLWDTILWYILQGIVIIILVFLLYLVIKRLVKFVKPLYNKIMNLLFRIVRRDPNELSRAGYLDENTSLGVWKGLKGAYDDRLKRWLSGRERPLKWGQLKTNKERIRFLYTQTILRAISSGYKYKSYLTPQETMLDMQKWRPDADPKAVELAELYNDVRYGELEVEDIKINPFIKYK